MIRKLFRHLLLRGLILAFTGDQTAAVFEEPETEVQANAAARATPAFDQPSSDWHAAFRSETGYEIVRGTGW